MQFAEEYAEHRLNAYAERERARELELRRVIAERTALAHEQHAAAGKARGTVGVAVGAGDPVVPEPVTVETVLGSAPAVAVGAAGIAESDSRGGADAREELHAAMR